jgi:hypothetical protein
VLIVHERGGTFGGLPPGIHLYVEIVVGAHRRQLRILGDDDRGYLIAGLPDGIVEDDFWFPTLTEAKRAGQRLGVPIDRWAELESVAQVRAG